MEELKLEIEELEKRIAPSFAFLADSPPDDAGANPAGGQNGNDSSFGPDSGAHPTKAAWTAHGNRGASGLPGSPVGSDVLGDGQNQ